MDSEIEVAAVKFVLGGHLTAVAACKGGLGICNVQLKQVDLWKRVVRRDQGGPSLLKEAWPPTFSAPRV